MTTKTKGLLTVLTAYVIAVIFGFISLHFSENFSSILQILIADIIATFVIYAFSVFYKNSSFMIHIGQLYLRLLPFFG